MKYTLEIPCVGTCLEALRVEVDAETFEAAMAWAKLNKPKAIKMGVAVPGRTEYDAPTAKPTTTVESSRREIETVEIRAALTQEDYSRLMESMTGIQRVEIGHKRPTPERPAACLYCRFYSGSNHGGNFLVCAMHPYGPEGDTCEDKEMVKGSQ